MLSLCSVEAQTLQNLFPPFPRGWGQVSHPEPGLSRGEETADRESLSVLAEPRSQSCQPILGTGSSWTSPAVCVWGGKGVCLCLSCQGRPNSTLVALSSVLTVTPEHPQTTGLGGQSCLWLLDARRAECASSLASQPDLEVRLVTHFLCHHAYLLLLP